MSRRAVVAVTLAALVALVAAVWLVGGTEPAGQLPAPSIQEDDPGWNCKLDGSRECGGDR